MELGWILSGSREDRVSAASCPMRDTRATGRSDDGLSAQRRGGRAVREGEEPIRARGSSAARARCRAGGGASPRRARRAASARWAPSAARRRPSSRRCRCSGSRGRPCCRRRDGCAGWWCISRQPSRRGSPCRPSSPPCRACRTAGSRRCRSPPGSEEPGGRAHHGGGAEGERDDARIRMLCGSGARRKSGAPRPWGTERLGGLFLRLSEPHLLTGQGVGATPASSCSTAGSDCNLS